MVEKTVSLEEFGPVKAAAIEQARERRGAAPAVPAGFDGAPEPRTKAA